MIYKPFCRTRFESSDCYDLEKYRKPSLVLIAVIKHKDPYISSQFVILALLGAIMAYFAGRKYLNRPHNNVVQEQLESSDEFKLKCQ